MYSWFRAALAPAAAMAKKAVRALSVFVCVAFPALVEATSARNESVLGLESESVLQASQSVRVRNTSGTTQSEGYEDVTEECLKLHNKFRTAGLDVGVPELVANPTARNVVMDIVKKRAADKCAKEEHSEEARKAGMGENIFYADDANCAIGVKMWYDEVKILKGNYPGTEWNRMGTIGHFTQVMWETSQGMACARTTSCPKWNQLFCVYKPAGNWIGVAPFSEAVWMSILKRDGMSGALSVAQVSAGSLAAVISAVLFILAE